MRLIAFILVSFALVACNVRKPENYYEELERASTASYQKYYFGDYPSRLSAAKDLIRVMDATDPKTWKHMNRGYYAGQAYGRASLAAERMGAKAEAAEYRRQAVLAWQKRKDWNYAYQEMLPITPSLDFASAESELFTLIERMDHEVREKAKKKSQTQ